MNAKILVKNGSTSDGTAMQRIILWLLWCISWVFIPIKFRGFWRITRLVYRVTCLPSVVYVTLPNAITYQIDMRDPYWNRLISPQFNYEPELHTVLKAMQHEPYSFIDCGANMGYWTCFAPLIYNAQHVASIEPLSSNMELLNKHTSINNVKSTLYHNAVSHLSGESCKLYKPRGHASVSLLNDDGEDMNVAEHISTITLDDVYGMMPPQAGTIFVKLDVEGVEVQALQGAIELLATNPLIFYEDHGMDVDCTISQYILDVLNYAIAYIHDNGTCTLMPHLSDIKKIKTDTEKGYNFLAYQPHSNAALSLLKQLQAS